MAAVSIRAVQKYFGSTQVIRGVDGHAQGEFIVGDYDRLLGHIGGMPFYISGPQFEYWQHTQLIIDVVSGRGGMFSLEGPEGVRFLTRSRLFTDEEWAVLEAAEAGQARRT